MEHNRILNECKIKKYISTYIPFTNIRKYVFHSCCHKYVFICFQIYKNDKVFKQAKHILHSTKHTVRFLSTNITRTISDCRK